MDTTAHGARDPIGTGTRYAYPADFCLIAAMNPCPCGYYGDVFRQCTCTPGNVQKYQKRISGPLLDRKFWGN